jgi:threonine dehydrogenase-like Zn-dependent dehydrogenase
MSDKMTVVMCHAPRDYRLGEISIPKIGREEVFLKVGACGICASDVKCYRGAPRIWDDKKQPRFVNLQWFQGANS